MISEIPDAEQFEKGFNGQKYKQRYINTACTLITTAATAISAAYDLLRYLDIFV